MTRIRAFAPFATALLLLGLGCATPETVQRRSSLASYLGGPKPGSPPTQASAGPARVPFPFRLGLAFVPADATQARGDFPPSDQLGPLSPGQEPDLHRRVAASFAGKPWVREVTTIPS
ncbi:MAG TPA: hypothetical protein VF768_07070, partial [Holophagaceae bacterium]